MKKILALLTALFLMVTTFVGCSSKENSTTSTSGEKKEISFMIPEWGVPTDEMLKEFEEKNNIKVNVMVTSWDDIRNKIATAAGKNAAADVFEVDWAWVGEFKKSEWLAPIELSKEDVADFKTAPTFTVDGKLYAVPYSNDYRIAYYNKAMYEKAGLTEAPKTWDEVIKNAKVLKEKGVVEYPISNPMSADEKSTTTFLWMAYTRNGKVFNEDNTLN